jgi:hypothetical protein
LRGLIVERAQVTPRRDKGALSAPLRRSAGAAGVAAALAAAEIVMDENRDLLQALA